VLPVIGETLAAKTLPGAGFIGTGTLTEILFFLTFSHFFLPLRFLLAILIDHIG
jgi:hypothetical protein